MKLVHLSAIVATFGLIWNVAAQPNRNNNNAAALARVFCGPDTLLMYEDCRVCTCARPNAPAKCFRKSCDLRTKDSGKCPPSYLKLNQYDSCPGEGGNKLGDCKVDNDCPGDQLCCFDFCRGAHCTNPQPLVTKNKHPGRGYPSA